jgi:hypothetical protein
MAGPSQQSKGGGDFGRDFAPALGSEPTYERVGADRWQSEIGDRHEHFAPAHGDAASGNWADTRSAFDLPSLAGPGFLDPGSHALANHVGPMMASEAMQFGALTGASMELGSLGTAPASTTPEAGFGGGGGGDDEKPSDKSLF